MPAPAGATMRSRAPRPSSTPCMAHLLRLAALALVAAATAARAQPPGPAASGAPGLRLLAIPDGHRMLCRVPEPGEAIAPPDQPVVQREFLFDPPSTDGLPPDFPVDALVPRAIVVVFDSAGAPLVMTDRVQLQRGGGEHLLVLFTGNIGAQGQHVRVDVDSARLAAATAAGDLAAARGALNPPVSRDVTEGEVERVRTLAAWLWPRRCTGGAGR